MPHTAPAPPRTLGRSDVLAELLGAAEQGATRRPGASTGALARTNPVDTQVAVSYAALLERNDAEFVHHAFVELLGRKPDSGALAYYGDGLRSGRLTKAIILGVIRFSPEGRTIGKIVPGLRQRFLLHRSYRLPLVGRLLRVASSVLALPRALRDLQRLEQMAHADRVRLDRLERALAASGPQLGVRVALAEVRLHDLGAVENRLAALEQRLDAKASSPASAPRER